MKSLKFIFLFILPIIIVSCDASFGERYKKGNLEIYYTPKSVADRYVIAMGKYFEENNLIQDEKHSIQLTSNENEFILKMVLNESFKLLPDNQRHNLDLLESDIKATVFNGLNFRIVVCNANFVPIDKEK